MRRAQGTSMVNATHQSARGASHTAALRLACVALALASSLAACTIQETGRADSITADSLALQDQRGADEVRRAVAVAREIRSAPDSAARALATHGLTRAGLDSLLYRIAADPRLAALYERGLGAANSDEL